jgi:hypothetical protein
MTRFCALQAKRSLSFYFSSWRCFPFVESAPRAYRLKASNAASPNQLRASGIVGNFLRTLATPEPIKDWSLTSLKEKLIKIGAEVVRHGRYAIFQIAEVAIARRMLREFCGSSRSYGHHQR